MCTPIPRSMRKATTPSPSKTKAVHPNRGDGKFTRPERASRCDNLNFSKRCPKLPEWARSHWWNSGPSKPLDCCLSGSERRLVRRVDFDRDWVRSGSDRRTRRVVSARKHARAAIRASNGGWLGILDRLHYKLNSPRILRAVAHHARAAESK